MMKVREAKCNIGPCALWNKLLNSDLSHEIKLILVKIRMFKSPKNMLIFKLGCQFYQK